MDIIANFFFLILLALVILIILVLFFQPRFILSIAQAMIPGVFYFVPTNEKIIALSIDDGPDNITTMAILSILEGYDAHATFFIISSKVKGNESIIKEIISKKHELGNHLTDDRPSIQLTSLEFEQCLLNANNVLSKFAQVRWLRPASGWYNKKMIKIANKHNYEVVLGSIFPYDTFIVSSEFASTHILANISPGSIIVLHDGGNWGKNTALTLKKILPVLSKKGYKIVTISQLVNSLQTK
jgi:peptidoglycan/xylan/chitin deacetylase (PgdA/CDA1 family)